MSSLIYSITDFINHLNSELGILIFIIVYILSIIFILPASWLSLLGGYLYGPFLGTLIVFFSAFLGASFSYMISRRFLSERVKKIINQFSKLSLLEKVIQKGGLKLIIFSRLSPIFPFSILNYFYGLNKISYKNFALGLLCILPGTYFYCSLGSIANNLNEIINLKFSDNAFISIVSVISTALVIYWSSKYANEIINETQGN